MKIGFIAGAFDLLHPGHLHAFANAKKHCDALIVGLHVDPGMERVYKNRPIQTIFERYMQLASCKYVYKIIPYETEYDLIQILHTINIDIRFVGTEYKGKGFTGKNIIPIKFISRDHGYSTSMLKSRL